MLVATHCVVKSLKNNKRFVRGARGRREPDLLPRVFVVALLLDRIPFLVKLPLKNLDLSQEKYDCFTVGLAFGTDPSDVAPTAKRIL
jgi:hypothetical protein